MKQTDGIPSASGTSWDPWLLNQASKADWISLAPPSIPPTMVSHGGIPSQMILNPEPNLRPTTPHPTLHREIDHTSGSHNEPRNPTSTTEQPIDPTSRTSVLAEPPRATTRTTIPVTVRSKQWASSTEDPQPKKKQRSASVPEARTPATERHGHPGPLPVVSEVPPGDLNSDDSDYDAVSGAAPTHDHSDTDINYRFPPSSITTSTTPPGTSTLTLTPNPKAPPPSTIQPSPVDPPRDPPFPPWTNTDDQELISLKQDTKSRPSWKTIGARLHRDPQVCKLRWGILKQTDQHGRVHPPHEPEAED